MIRLVYLCLVLGVTRSVLAAGQDGSGYVPPEGFVPTAETAIRIAEAVWEPIYGANRLKGEKPFHATLDHGVWIVTGTFPLRVSGGTAVAKISQQDGRIIFVSHGK